MEVILKISKESPEHGGRSEFEILCELFISYQKTRNGYTRELLYEIHNNPIPSIEDQEEVNEVLNESSTFLKLMERFASGMDHESEIGSLSISHEGILQLNDQKPGSEQLFEGD